MLQVFHHNVIPNITWSRWGRDISKSFHRIERQHLAFNYYLDSGCAGMFVKAAVCLLFHVSHVKIHMHTCTRYK